MQLAEIELMDMMIDGLIGSSVVFEGINAPCVRSLVQDIGCTAHSYRAGEQVIGRGERIDYYPVVLQGSVTATIEQGGKSRHVVSVGSGDTFAEAIPMMGLASPVTVRADGITTVLHVPVEALNTSQAPAARRLRDNISRRMGAKVGALVQNIAVIGEPRAEARVLAYIQTLPADKDGFCTLPFGLHKDWADYLRMDEKTLSRKLSDMRSSGLIETAGDRLRLTPAGLAAYNNMPADQIPRR